MGLCGGMLLVEDGQTMTGDFSKIDIILASATADIIDPEHRMSFHQPVVPGHGRGGIK